MKRAKFPPKGDPEEEGDDDKPSPAKKPKGSDAKKSDRKKSEPQKSDRPELIKGAKKRKSTPMSREERMLMEIRQAPKKVELCIPCLPYVRYVMC